MTKEEFEEFQGLCEHKIAFIRFTAPDGRVIWTLLDENDFNDIANGNEKKAKTITDIFEICIDMPVLADPNSILTEKFKEKFRDKIFFPNYFLFDCGLGD